MIKKDNPTLTGKPKNKLDSFLTYLNDFNDLTPEKQLKCYLTIFVDESSADELLKKFEIDKKNKTIIRKFREIFAHECPQNSKQTSGSELKIGFVSYKISIEAIAKIVTQQNHRKITCQNEIKNYIQNIPKNNHKTILQNFYKIVLKNKQDFLSYDLVEITDCGDFIVQEKEGILSLTTQDVNEPHYVTKERVINYITERFSAKFTELIKNLSNLDLNEIITNGQQLVAALKLYPSEQRLNLIKKLTPEHIANIFFGKDDGTICDIFQLLPLKDRAKLLSHIKLLSYISKNKDINLGLTNLDLTAIQQKAYLGEWKSVNKYVSHIESMGKDNRQQPVKEHQILPRKGLSDISNENLTNLLKLPNQFVVGMAVDDGGCFFDGLAQALNQIQKTTKYSEKFLRMSCHEYYVEHKEKVNELNKNDYQGIDNGEDYYFVQYTNSELEKDFSQRPPIWGRSNIEGVILCRQRQLEIKAIHLIELVINPENKEYIAAHFCITKNKATQVDQNDILFENDIPTLIVSQKELHFVPLLQKEAHFEIENSTKIQENRKKQSATEVCLKEAYPQILKRSHQYIQSLNSQPSSHENTENHNAILFAAIKEKKMGIVENLLSHPDLINGNTLLNWHTTINGEKCTLIELIASYFLKKWYDIAIKIAELCSIVTGHKTVPVLNAKICNLLFLYAAHNGKWKAVKWMLNNNIQMTWSHDDFDWYAIHFATASGKNDLVLRFLNIDNTLLTSEDFEKLTPIQLAAKYKQWETVEAIAKNYQASYDDPEHYGYVLLIAAKEGRWNTAKLLLEKNASVMWGDPVTMKAAIHFAAEAGQTDLVAAILKKNRASFLRKTKDELTPIGLAAQNNQWNTVRKFQLNDPHTRLQLRLWQPNPATSPQQTKPDENQDIKFKAYDKLSFEFKQYIKLSTEIRNILSSDEFKKSYNDEKTSNHLNDYPQEMYCWTYELTGDQKKKLYEQFKNLKQSPIPNSDSDPISNLNLSCTVQ